MKCLKEITSHQLSIFDINYLVLDNIHHLYFKISFPEDLSSACGHLQEELPHSGSS